MIDFKLYPTERLIYVYTDDTDGIDIYDFDLLYIGNDTPKIVLTNSIYKDIVCSINNVYNEIDDEHISYQMPEQYVGIDTSVIECNSCNSDVTPNEDAYSNKKRIVALIHWWFIDRDILEFNLIENIHIDNIINKILPVCNHVRLNVVFDTDKYEYRQFIETYFDRFDKIHITYDINDSSKCEYLTYQHVFDYDNCYVMYMHFKGIGCIKSADGLSSFCKNTISHTIDVVNYLYSAISSFHPDEIVNKLFWGIYLCPNTFNDAIIYNDAASHLYYGDTFYVVNVDFLKTYSVDLDNSITSLRKFLVSYSELFPSLFPLSLMHHKSI